VIVAEFFKSEVVYLTGLPSEQTFENPIVIFDRKLLKSERSKKWLESFKFRYGVEAGEKLKQIESFQLHVDKLLSVVEKMQTKKITLVAVGGGSVGDFVGFLASVFKRGVPLIHIPSTWLAAMDSAHGGKTALNAGGFKNQIGTFYPAQKVIISRALLYTQPPERVTEAIGEILKTALLAGGSLWKQIQAESRMDQKKLWTYLPPLIQYKYKIVEQDPFEKKGIRYFLNFGHTFGHAFELSEKIPHGVAVNWGLWMALEFSVAKKILSKNDFLAISASALLKNNLASPKVVIRGLKKAKSLSALLLQDKKMSEKGLVHFVFLKKLGQPQVLKVSVRELIEFSERIQE
jgi:3-dehydroquinate synthase